MDEFSFPSFAKDPDRDLYHLPFTHFTSSPTWFLSPSEEDGTKTAEESKCCNGLSLVKETDKSKADELAKDDQEESLLLGDGKKRDYVSDEERMDMLWENFNEELYGIDYKGVLVNNHKSDAEKHGMVELCCVPALGMPKSSSSIIRHNRPIFLMLMRVIKKLLLAQKTDSSRKSSIF